MSVAKASADYRMLTALQAFPSFSTPAMFDCGIKAAVASPIDVFIGDSEELNRLFLSYAVEGVVIPAPLGSLVLLGYSSAVETYLRSIIRRTVLVDETARRRTEPLPLTFGAAFHQDRALLPEALLERFSFAGRRGICDALLEVLGVKLDGREVEVALDEFARICEIRHCCVHRGGRLGSQNAIKLGLDDHAKALERPFRPSNDDLQVIADSLRTFVKTMNNFLFTTILERTVDRGGRMAESVSWSWKWEWKEDRRTFMRYYDVFASKADFPASAKANQVYRSFVAHSGPGGERWLDKRRAREARREAEAKARIDEGGAAPGSPSSDEDALSTAIVPGD